MKLIDLLRPPRLKLVRSPPAKVNARILQIEGRPVKIFNSGFEIAWLSELAIIPETIVEIGSYDGGDAIRFREAFPTARIVTVEADPERARTVRTNCAGRSIELVEAAMLDVDGPVGWHQATVDGRVDAQGSLYLQTDKLNRRFPHVKQRTEKLTVPGRRLDSLCAELGIAHIDFLHLDIQGAEFVALQGLGQIRPTAIFLELLSGGWIGAKSVKETTTMLDDWGYRLAAEMRHDRLYVATRA